MNDQSGKPWTFVVRSLVLYNEDVVWRFAIYNDAGIVDGRLRLDSGAPVEHAQQELLRLVMASTGHVYAAAWSSTEPGWWTGDVTLVE